MSVQLWAERYINRGWKVVPLIPGERNVGHKDWQKLTFTPDMFRENDNIGIKSVDGLVVIDIDCPEGVKCADDFLPQTGAIYGRSSKPRSKRLYHCTGTEKIHVFRDQKSKKNVIELRANHQDMAPPSIHPSGEKLSWDGPIQTPATVEHQDLLHAVKILSTACLMIRYYNPPKARHTWMLSFVGTCRRLGFTEEVTTNLVQSIARHAGDQKTQDRLLEVRSTYARSEDDPITGIRSFEEECEEPKLAESLRKIWMQKEDFITTKDGKIIANNQDNIRLALRKLNVELSFDRFSRKQFMNYQGNKMDLEDEPIIRIWLEIDQQFKFRPSKLFFIDVIQDLAQQSPYHPVIDYLKNLEWDGTPRLDEWLIRAAKVQDTPYVRAISKIPILAAVRRVMNPGCLFQEMLILESNEQGLEKSSMIQALCPYEDWFSDNLPLNVDSKQVIERTSGKWIIEASDLSGMRSSQVEGLKAMLSRRVDGPVRMAYAHVAREQPRQFIIVGTTNSYNYLIDPTGNRRFWPVRCDNRCDIRWVIDNRDQLWAEAYKREQKGESIRLDPSLWGEAAEQQNMRTVEDPWEITIADAFNDHYQRLTSEHIWKVLGILKDRRDKTAAYRVAAVMQRLGFRRMSVRSRNSVSRGWGRGDKITDGS